MQTPIMNGAGSRSRKSILALVQIDHLYPQHREFLQAMVHRHFSIALLEAALIRESLNLTVAASSVRTAWTEAYVGTERVPPVTEEALQLGTALLRSIRALWNQPPFDHPDVIIYDAKRHGYIGMALAVEVVHREPLPHIQYSSTAAHA